jgi:photoactive yellow protein
MTNTNVAADSGAGPGGVQTESGWARRTFADITFAELNAADDAALNELSFGVVGLDASGRTRAYNLFESGLAGLSRDSVLSQEFFLTTGVCMNNFLVAQRFVDEPVLDVTLDYVLTFRMRPTPAKLRLLQQPDGRLHYILIQR